ncbi:hypothetical protein AB0C27_09890 [Nonomuraea sp. NPDC048882]|uniref:hypothetical protein n=1 Tax=Nonomuraea sp. NPDC048882 TaxID=3154347 RepID=UPI0033CCF9FC
MKQTGETRSDSRVTLDNVVVHPGPNGSVHVVASVERTWTQTSPDDPESRSGPSTRGVVQPIESTISIHVFDRCGNVTEIQAPLPRYQDGTDGYDPCSGFVDPDGTQHEVCQDLGGAAGSGGPTGTKAWNALKKCANGGCRSELFGWDYSTKGIVFEAGAVLIWAYNGFASSPLKASEWSAYTNVKPTGSFGKSKVDKFVLNNLRLEIKTSVTISSLVLAPGISWPPSASVSESGQTGSLSANAEAGVRGIRIAPVKFSTTCDDLFCGKANRLKHQATGTLSLYEQCKSNPSKPKDCKIVSHNISIQTKYWWAETVWPLNYDETDGGDT